MSTTTSRTAIVVARGGPRGSEQTLQTLESLVTSWANVDDWDVILLSPPDRFVTAMIELLEGSIVVEYGDPDVPGAIARCRELGREHVVLNAGDVAAPLETMRGLTVPLVDRQGINPATGEWLESMSSFNARADGHGLLTWVRGVDPSMRYPVAVFTNLSLPGALSHRASAKVAWMIESPEVYPESVAFLRQHPNLFDLVVTSDASLAGSLPRAVTIPLAGCWVPPDDQRVWPKSRGTSMVASGKGFTSGHKLRQEIVRTFGGFDLYGRGLVDVPNLGAVDNKADALRDYRFSIAVENTWTDAFFSEKIIDCFRTGTIPIWWGSAAVFDHFNRDGILTFSSADGLRSALRSATPAFYEERIDAVRDNFERAAAWRVVEDRLHPHLTSLF